MFLEAVGITKSYPVGSARLPVLKGLDLSLERGEMVAVMGASGVGKSTLLHVLGGLDSVDSGTVRIGETDLTGLPDADVVAFRNRHVGFVFSSIICSRNSPRSRTRRCRCASRAARPTSAPHARGDC
jgi:ABC-type lipoprotein export system ATPase subunit